MTKEEILKQYYGYDVFREGQETVIDSILNGQDTLGIMPTGAGKSVCYQVPALMMEGITLVISPLISLMKDQVGALNQAGVHAAYINSSLTPGQCRLALQYAAQGRYKLVYVAPERLMTGEFLDFAVHSEISMLTVDEAHCISQWGQDFRPDYLKIVEFMEALPKRPVLSAFTATATTAVKEDIICTLKMRQPTVLLTGFDRKNLFFSVETPSDKYKRVSEYISSHKGDSGIIYCSTRKNVEEVHRRLVGEGIPAARYHAGLSDGERRKNQDDFIFDNLPVMVATNAFGMGIDKSNVRFVIHYNMPKDMESYYQEAGRAGRDGEESDCLLLYSGQDVAVNQYMIENSHENEQLLPEELELIKERDRGRLKKMTFYCQTNDCLRAYILNYFGEYTEAYCGKCQNCLTSFETKDVTDQARRIIGCVQECGQRYGINLILNTLMGANTAKIRQYHMEESEYYGSEKEYKIYTLRQILNHLLMNGYLELTDSEYPVLRLREASIGILSGGKTVSMKLAREAGKKKPKEKKQKVSAEAVQLTEEETYLFQSLRELRYQLAKEEGCPPYIIFSDKTLRGMCRQHPRSLDEMLLVSGVGENKLQKYGSIFLDEILSAGK